MSGNDYLRLVRPSPRRKAAMPADAAAAPEPPEWLSDRRKELWREAAAVAPPGLLKAIDAGALARYVVYWDIFADAARRIEVDPDQGKAGYLARAPKTGTPMHSVIFTAMNNAAQGMRAEAAVLGFDPASRNRIGVTYAAPRKQTTAAAAYLKPAT